MPTLPKRSCSFPGCPVSVTSGSRCQAHGGSIAKRLLSSTQGGRGYGWQRIVHDAIRLQPWCTWRGRPECQWAGDVEQLTGDHIIPRAHGGQSIPENCRVLCRSCNSRRGAP
jgi:5-methylcytosine-specific restriction endonuclease McrA